MHSVIMSYIWVLMILLSIVYALLTGQGKALSDAVITGAQAGITLTMSIAGSVCLWCGLGKAMEVSGISNTMAKAAKPMIRKLFPCVKDDPIAGGYISSNLCANLLGLGNAATPMGIAATKRMARLAPSGQASNEMCRLIVLNTASIQLIPTNVAAVRSSLGANNSFDILPAVWLTSLCSVAVGLLAARCFERVWRK